MRHLSSFRCHPSSKLIASQNMAFKKQGMAGFTLLEVLIAIGITAMIGLGSWQILNSAIRTSEHTQVKLEELKALQKTMLILSRDMQQIVPRSVRDEYGDYQPALQTKGSLYKLELSRAGWRNPLGDPRSNIQRVAYELNQDELVRHYWKVLDRSQDSESVYRTMLKGVEEFTIRFMKDDDGWTDEWPSASNDSGDESTSDPRANVNELPKAIKVTLKLKQFGTVSKLYDLVSYLPNKALEDNTAGGAGAGADNASGAGDTGADGNTNTNSDNQNTGGG